ncbi:MAG: hypothetical protein GY796_26805 [Chloroflexi bacterium]|nr:hypothetical protein [Chloroflexota bacterium]
MLPYLYHLHFSKHRENELIEQARIARLLAEIRAEKPGIRVRFLINSGAILILIGRKLKEHYEPETHLALQQPILEGSPGR